MIDFNKYFIVGTNSYALHDTMNGMVVGELIRCKDCAFYDSEQMCVAFLWMHGKPIKIAKNADDYCSLAERKDNETD